MDVTMVTLASIWLDHFGHMVRSLQSDWLESAMTQTAPIYYYNQLWSENVESLFVQTINIFSDKIVLSSFQWLNKVKHWQN